MTEPIRGAVAAILNKRELVLNVGSESGVKDGMKFAILNRNSLDVTDPDTGEVIGSVEVAKVIVEVARVEPRLSIARTYRERNRNVGGSMGIGALFEPTKVVKEVETLQVTNRTYQDELDEEDSYVKVGDPAVENRD